METLEISKYVLAGMLIIAGILHFLKPKFYLKIMPDYLPAPLLLVILSGIAEIICGLLLVFPNTQTIGAYLTIALFVAVFPAEQLAADFLEKKGYKILVKNYRYQKAEIDIIASFENLIIIVEVKARGSDIFMEPQEAVTKKKIKSLVMAADFFMKDRNLDQEVRFDIIAVLPDERKKLQITHLEDAFQSFDAN